MTTTTTTTTRNAPTPPPPTTLITTVWKKVGAGIHLFLLQLEKVHSEGCYADPGATGDPTLVVIVLQRDVRMQNNVSIPLTQKPLNERLQTKRLREASDTSAMTQMMATLQQTRPLETLHPLPLVKTGNWNEHAFQASADYANDATNAF